MPEKTLIDTSKIDPAEVVKAAREIAEQAASESSDGTAEKIVLSPVELQRLLKIIPPK
jgi:hypothetical protein